MNGTLNFRFLRLAFLFVFVCLAVFPAGNHARAAAPAAARSQQAGLQDDGEDPLPDPIPGGEELPNEPLLEPAISESGLVGYSAAALGAMSSRGAYCTTPVRIMPLGDSITHGDGDCTDPKPGGNEEFCSGYRNELWSYLTSTYSVDFVGNEHTGRVGDQFDKDYEGHPGYRADQIAANIYGSSGGNWIVTTPGEPANIILLHIGTNDVGYQTTTIEAIRIRIKNILNKIDDFEKQQKQDVWVILAQIVRRKDSYNQKTKDLNQEIEALYQERRASGDLISLVDMYSVVPVAEMFDTLHPNNNGYKHMAEVWQSALADILVCAVDDQHTVSEDSQKVTLNVLGNDSGTSLPVKSVSSGSEGGTVILEGGVVKYTPSPNFFGLETFTYTLQSVPGMNPTATVSVNVTPVNDPPRAVDDHFTVPEDGGAQVFEVLSNDSITPDTGETLFLAQVSSGSANGSISIQGSEILYTPAPDFFGEEMFTYTIHDGEPGSNATASVTVTVTPVDDPPEIAPISERTSFEGARVSFKVQASDVDSDEITYSARGLPPGVTIDSHSGWISGIVKSSAAGDYAVKITATCNGTATTTSFTWTIIEADQVVENLFPLVFDGR